MINMNGSIIKSKRKELGINQIDLAGKELSRNQLSYIENNKTNLTHRTAKYIHYNMHLHSWLLGKAINFHFDELLNEDEEYLVFRNAQKILQKIEMNKIHSISELIETFELYAYAPIGFLKIPLLIQIAKKIENHSEQNFVVDIYEKVLNEYRNADFPKEYNPYLKIRPVINELILYYNSNMQYRKMIDLIQYWRAELINSEVEILPSIYFNLALAYSKLGSFDLSHKTIDSFLAMKKKNAKDEINAYTIKANTYFRENKFIESFAWYQKGMHLSQVEGLKDEYALALSNLINAYVSEYNSGIQNTFIEAYSNLLRIDQGTIGPKATSFLLYAKAIGAKFFTPNISAEQYCKLLSESLVFAFNYSHSSFFNIVSSIIDETDNYDLLVQCLDFVLLLEEESSLDDSKISSLLIILGRKLSKLEKHEHVFKIFDVLNNLKGENHGESQQTL